ncbi:MAG: hypothetical protein WCG85_04835 [Polyangia bacterium]
MTGAGIMALCVSRGLRLSPAGDGLLVAGPKDARAELRETIREHKQELVSLLRSQRQTEVSTAFAEAFARLGNLYDGDLVGSLWARIVDQHPPLASDINTAETAADGAAVAYQQGTVADSSQFLAALAMWERTWAEAIAAVTGDVCSDCHTHSTVLIGVDYDPSLRYCRRCLRPTPLNRKAPHA